MNPNLTLDEFPPVSTAQWNEVVRADMKGAAPKNKLFYRAEDLPGDYLDAPPGVFPYTRGTHGSNDWRIRQTVGSVAEAQAALDAGADEIGFVLGNQDALKILAALPACIIHFAAGDRAAAVLAVLAGSRVRGSIDYEPLADFDRAVKLIRTAANPEFKPVTIRAHRFSEAGATPVQELAFALAEGIEILDHIPDAASAIVFSFAIGPNYFQEIARLRAARTLWARIVESFGLGVEAAKMTIHARSAHWTESVYDAHVNLLRSTTQAMAAAIGGADSIEVEPFDGTYRASDETSRRLARNAQLILKREALLDRSVDPAGGAYYLESLTDSVAREAWALVQQIEAAGGFLKYSASGALDQAVVKSRADRDTAVSTRRTTIVGTNQYPNPAERMAPKIERPDPAPRPARIFEEIRLRSERQGAPRLLLREAGDPKMRKARSGFIANFFGCGGFEVRISDSLTGAFDAVVLCSSDPEYAALAPRVIQELRAAGKNTPVLVAGNPTDSMEQLKLAGVADFIHIRTNAAEALRTWQDRLGPIREVNHAS
jgi:methylmalonyl-CoA mutase